MDVKLPPLGEGADSGTVVSILVKEGDSIEKGQSLIELETGKAVAPIPSPAAGKVSKIHVQQGAKLAVGQSILSLAAEARSADKKADPPAKRPAKEAAPKEEEPADDDESPSEESRDSNENAEAPDDGEEISEGALPPPASPSLRRIARELGIDLRRIRGSERGGRIVIGDLRAHVQRLQKLAAQARPGPSGKSETPAAPQTDFLKWGPIAKRPMTSLRKVISRRMSENWNAIPHVTQFDDADITRLMELRKKLAPAYEKEGGRLTLTGFALKAVVKTLKKHPVFNTSLDEAAEEVIYKEYYHIGVAVDTEHGLIVPVIRDVDKKDLLALSKELAALAEKARDRKLSIEELQGGSFSISNQGSFGGAHFTPIVNKPETAILGIGKGALKPVVTKDKSIEPRLLLPLALSYDHRVIDGGSAARFMEDLVAAFEGFPEEEAAIQ